MTTRTTGCTGVRRAAVLFCGAGLALAGLVTMIVLWVQVATAALTEGAQVPGTCVTAAGEGVGDARVTYAALPPSATCTWTVDGGDRGTDRHRAGRVLLGGGLDGDRDGRGRAGAGGGRGCVGPPGA